MTALPLAHPAAPQGEEGIERLKVAAQALLTAGTTRALRGRDHVPSMRDEQDARGALSEALAALAPAAIASGREGAE